jgi:lipopolysaccharide transport system permease protein
MSAEPAVEAVYTPRSRPRGFTFGGFSPRSYWDLLVALVSSQVKVKYRYTFIGLGWALVNPLLLMFVYGYVFGEIFSVERANYRLFLLAGLLPWQAFSGAVSNAVGSLVSESDLLKKAPFPSELLPMASVLSAMISFFIVFVVYAGFLATRGYDVIGNAHWLILAIAIQTAFLMGISLALSCLNVFFRDLEQLTSFAVWMLFFLTPIIYPLSRLGADRAGIVMHLNPMAVVVTTIQNALLKGHGPPTTPLLSAMAISAAVLGIGWMIFRRYQYELPKVL